MVNWGDMNKIKFPPLAKECQVCGNIYYKKIFTSKKTWKKSKYCSFKCLGDSKKGKPFFDSTGIPAWNKGKVGYMSLQARINIADCSRERINNWTPEQRKKRHIKSVATRKAKGNFKGQLGKSKKQIYAWKGDKAGYSSKHKWIQKHWTKTGICENCGNSPKPTGNRKYGTEFHSKDHKYNREDRKTWLEVCKRCHNKLDKNL